jgi:hypothetical protein
MRNRFWKAAPWEIKKWRLSIKGDFGEIVCEYRRWVKLSKSSTEWIGLILVPRLVFGSCQVRALARISAVITKVPLWFSTVTTWADSKHLD